MKKVQLQVSLLMKHYQPWKQSLEQIFRAGLWKVNSSSRQMVETTQIQSTSEQQLGSYFSSSICSLGSSILKSRNGTKV